MTITLSRQKPVNVRVINASLKVKQTFVVVFVLCVIVFMRDGEQKKSCVLKISNHNKSSPRNAAAFQAIFDLLTELDLEELRPSPIKPTTRCTMDPCEILNLKNQDSIQSSRLSDLTACSSRVQ